MPNFANQDELVVLQIRGDDRATWWSGQVSNDVKPALEGEQKHAVYGLILNAKGRVLSDALTFPLDSDVLCVSIPRTAQNTVLEHLNRYIIMEDVELSVAENLAVLSWCSTVGAPPAEGAHASPRYTREGVAGYELLVSPVNPPASVKASLQTSHAFRETLTRLGVPQFGVDFGEFTYPQEAGLETLAVSFNKGCYLGQEVVCMLESRGQVSRTLRRWRGDKALAPQTKLFAGDTDVGMVTSAAPDGTHTVGFALLKRNLPGDTTLLKTQDGQVGVTPQP